MRRVLLGIVPALMLAIAAANANAAIFFITAGNTQPTETSPNPDVMTVVNYAVLYRDGTSTWDDITGGSGLLSQYAAGGLDQDDSYLYLYQVVNLSQTPVALVEAISLGMPDVSLVNSAGYFAGAGFEFSNVLIDASNPAIGTLAPAVNDSTSTSVLSPLTSANLANLEISAISGTTVESPESVFINTFVNSVVARFNYLPDAPPYFISGETSVLIGFTSNYGPINGVAGIDDGATANGLVPVAGIRTPSNSFPILPEPASMAIWSLGLAMVGGVGAWRRRRLKAAA